MIWVIAFMLGAAGLWWIVTGVGYIALGLIELVVNMFSDD